MTVPACYASEGRRYSRGYPTPYFSDRRYISTHDAVSHSSRASIMTSERDVDGESNPPRKRIAVACLRCRKRKIRCSGDPGNGQPCNNCRNAGTEVCRFLRVSSQETPLRSDSTEFSYDLHSARAYHTRGPVPSLGPVASQLPHDGIPALASGEMLSQYRHGTGSAAYPYSGKGYYGTTVSAWSPHGYEDGVDYGLHLGTTPKYESGTSSTIYLGLESSYGYHGGGSPSPHGGLVHRPPPPPIPTAPAELPANFPLSTITDSLSTHQLHGSPSKERILPTPGRTLSSSVPYRAAVDAQAGPYQTAAAAASSTKVSSSAHGSPTISSIADVSTATGAGSYSAFDSAYCAQPSSALPSHGSSSSSSSSSSLSSAGSGRGGSDMYSSSESLFSAAEAGLHNQSSATDLSYRYSDSHSHRDGSASTTQLSNGHVYTSLPPPPAGGGGQGGYVLGDVKNRRVPGVNAV